MGASLSATVEKKRGPSPMPSPRPEKKYSTLGSVGNNKRKKNQRLLANTVNSIMQIKSVDETSLSISARGQIYNNYPTPPGTECEKEENFDLHRCFFVNPSDNTYLVLQLGAYEYCEVCLIKLGSNQKEIKGIYNPTSSMLPNSDEDNTKNIPAISYHSWHETEVNEQGIPKGSQIWNGRLTIPAAYFPVNTQLCSLETLTHSQVHLKSSIPNEDQFVDIADVKGGKELQKRTAGISRVWMDHLPV